MKHVILFALLAAFSGGAVAAEIPSKPNIIFGAEWPMAANKRQRLEARRKAGIVVEHETAAESLQEQKGDNEK